MIQNGRRENNKQEDSVKVRKQKMQLKRRRVSIEQDGNTHK